MCPPPIWPNMGGEYMRFEIDTYDYIKSHFYQKNNCRQAGFEAKRNFWRAPLRHKYVRNFCSRGQKIENFPIFTGQIYVPQGRNRIDVDVTPPGGINKRRHMSTFSGPPYHENLDILKIRYAWNFVADILVQKFLSYDRNFWTPYFTIFENNRFSVFCQSFDCGFFGTKISGI